MRLRRRSAEDLKSKIKDTFLAASAEEAGALACEGGGTEWIRRVNVITGVALRTQSILEKAGALHLAIPDSCRPPSAGTSAESRWCEWARRLRMRYGDRMGATPVGERLPPDELRAKDLFQDGFSTISGTALPLLPCGVALVPCTPPHCGHRRAVCVDF